MKVIIRTELRYTLRLGLPDFNLAMSLTPGGVLELILSSSNLGIDTSTEFLQDISGIMSSAESESREYFFNFFPESVSRARTCFKKSAEISIRSTFSHCNTMLPGEVFDQL
jgi:hypothetical protein